MKQNDKPDYNKEMIEKSGNNANTLYTSEPTAHTSFIQPLTYYTASAGEIQEVEKQIAANGFWEQITEWRISTFMTSRIEPQDKDGKKYFITTVKCEQEVMIPAKTVERAINFRKVYEDIQMELWHQLGWASWTKKDKP